MCKEVDGEVTTQKTPTGLPPPGQKHPLPDDPVIPPKHFTKLSNIPNPLEGKEIFIDIPLSDLSESIQ